MTEIEATNESFQDEPDDEERGRYVDIFTGRKMICICLFIICLFSGFIVGIFLGDKSAPVAVVSSPLVPSKAPSAFDKNHLTFVPSSKVPLASTSSTSMPYETSHQDSLTAMLKPFFASSDETFPSSPLQKKALDWISKEDSWLISQSSNEDRSINHLCERYISALLYFAFDGINWKDQKLWLSSHSTCNWKGIQCNREGRIAEIDLYYNFLSGRIPSEIGMLFQMTSLLLHKNELFGTIPTNLGMISQLQTANLSYNKLSGTIPSEIGELTELDSLELSHNGLTGTLPNQLENLARAGTHVYVGYNNVVDCDPMIVICT